MLRVAHIFSPDNCYVPVNWTDSCVSLKVSNIGFDCSQSLARPLLAETGGECRRMRPYVRCLTQYYTIVIQTQRLDIAE